MFDLIAGKADHIPARPALPIVISTALQVALVAGTLAPVLFFTGALPKPPMMMAFVAAPPPPPTPPPPPPPPPAARKETPQTARPVPTTSQSDAPTVVPRSIEPELLPVGDDEGVEGGVEGGIPGGVLGGLVGGVVGGLPEAPPPPAPTARREPVRVGGQIKQPTLVRRVEPIYPLLAVQANIEGLVIIEAIVDREGMVEEVRVLQSPNKLLEEAAITAVRQWQYSPVLLNGIAERFILTVALSFNLEVRKE